MATSSIPSHVWDLSQQAQKGDPEAIATLLNQQMNPKGIWIKVGWKDGCLGLLVEAASVPNPESITSDIYPILCDLNLETAQAVRIYGRQQGSHLPAWRREFQLVATAPSDHTVVSLMDWLTQGSDRQQEASQPLAPLHESRFLQCQLSAQDRILIALEDIQSVFQLTLAEILPVPNMPNCILGVYNYRGEMLWIVDLSAQIGLIDSLTVQARDTSLTAIALTHQESTLGFLMTDVTGIQTHPVHTLEMATQALFPEQSLPYLSGYLRSLGLPVLNTKAVMQDPIFQVHLR
ncbi:MAG: hypothetical protein EA367_03270 [Leptolyngbya sp. DLM2.Bin15]|nr:MAG: hypothetical protein EA367_03270 [Leptolyngbya sp. DLM2.Bin15]